MASKKNTNSTSGKKLTPKQQRFVEEYLIDLNGKQAAIRAGYSEKSAEAQASRLLSSAKVGSAVAKARAKLSEKTEITAARIREELGKVGFHEVQDNDPRVRTGDKIRALELLGKTEDMFTERHSVELTEVPLTTDDLMERIAKRRESLADKLPPR